MGLSDEHPPHYLPPLAFDPIGDKHLWQKNIRCWARMIGAWANEGDGREKRMVTALGVKLLRSLPISRPSMIGNSIEAENLIQNSSEESFGNNVMKCIESIINMVAKDTVPDANKRLSRLRKDA